MPSSDGKRNNVYFEHEFVANRILLFQAVETVAFTVHATRKRNEKKKSFVLLLLRRPLLFSWLFLSLYDIIKDPAIFSNAVADVQADVSQNKAKNKPKKKQKKRIYLCISFMCRVHSMGKRQQVDFFSFHFVYCLIAAQQNPSFSHCQQLWLLLFYRYCFFSSIHFWANRFCLAKQKLFKSQRNL